jgi:hypothetical protein
MQSNFPQQPQSGQQHPGWTQPNVLDALLGEILRAVTHIIAKDMHSDFLDRVAQFQDPHALLQVLHEYNNQNEIAIQKRTHLQKAPAPAGTPRRRADGTLDAFNQSDATARTRQIFEQALGKKGGR